jgi:hypothetical protein
VYSPLPPIRVEDGNDMIMHYRYEYVYEYQEGKQNKDGKRRAAHQNALPEPRSATIESYLLLDQLSVGETVCLAEKQETTIRGSRSSSST